MNQVMKFNPSFHLMAKAPLATHYGSFTMYAFGRGAKESCAVLMAGKRPTDGCLVRIHSACFTGDVFGSLHCDCAGQLHEAQRLIGEEGNGLLLYAMDHEGRGKGLVAKLLAYALQALGLNTVEADKALGLPVDTRSYKDQKWIIQQYFGLKSIRLLTNNPDKVAELEQAGLTVERVPFWPDVNKTNEGYIRTKQRELGHLAA